MTRVITQRKLGELGPEGSRKGVYSRQRVMQKEGLEYGGREFALPLATGEGGWQGAWGSLLSWNSASWAGFVWQERRGSSCTVAPTAGCDTECLWHLRSKACWSRLGTDTLRACL